jgi:transposase
MATISLDLRQRIVASYDQKEGTRADLAKRFRVSVGLVAKLLHQRRKTGDLAPRHRFSGRKPKLVGEHRRQLRVLLGKQPDLTLRELRATLELDCSLQAIHYLLAAMGLTYKKRHSAPASKSGPTLRERGGRGGVGRRVSSRAA